MRTGVYDKNAELIERYRAGDKQAGEELASLNRPLVYSVASRFLYRHPDVDELLEVGTLGLVKAINTFDPARECAFSTYAVPLIFGEIRRFLRDDGMIKVSREHKRLSASLLAEKERRTGTGESTKIADIAATLGVSAEDASAALFSSYPVRSLDECVFDDDEGETLASTVFDDEEEGRSLDRIALKVAIERLEPLQRDIVTLRYFRDMSQQRCAAVLGITQVKVSREEKKIMRALKKELS